MNYTVRILKVCQHVRDFEIEAESKESAEFKTLDFAYYQKTGMTAKLILA